MNLNCTSDYEMAKRFRQMKLYIKDGMHMDYLIETAGCDCIKA